MNRISRRGLLLALSANAALASRKVERKAGTHLRIGLNAYSFNAPLRAGTMTLDDLVEFCAEHRIELLDATGYYFPGYPETPPDEYLYALKRKAFVNGVTIQGTGVRNDFSLPDAAARRADVTLVKNWIDVAAKLGASVVRVFAGKGVPKGFSFEQVLQWMAADLRECAEYGKERGVIVGIQNHDDFLKTAADTVRLVEAVDSEWLGVVLDTGSLRQGDPYDEISKLIPYAVSWQLKESIWYGTRETAVDLPRIRQIIERAGYRGVVPIETLGEGDPRVKVSSFLERVRTNFGK